MSEDHCPTCGRIQDYGRSGADDCVDTDGEGCLRLALEQMRARALAAEQERDVLRERSEEWELYRYELWAQADDMWRLAWAMMWETIGTHAQYWSCRELLDETTDDRDRLRTQNWGYRVDRDRYWRLAWAAGWAAVGMAVIIWQWAEYRFACSDTPGATRRLDAMLDALDAATMGTIRNAIDAAHGKET